MLAVTYCFNVSANGSANKTIAPLQAGLAKRWKVSESDLVLFWQTVSSCDEGWAGRHVHLWDSKHERWGGASSDRRRVLNAAAARTEANEELAASSPLGVRGRSLNDNASRCTDSLDTFAETTTKSTALIALESSVCTVAAPPSPPEAPPPPSRPPPPLSLLPPSPPSLPPFVEPMRVRGAILVAASGQSLTVQWQPPLDAGTYELSRYVLYACEVADDAITPLNTTGAANATLALPCASVEVEPTSVRATVTPESPAGRHFVLTVEAQSDVTWPEPVSFSKVLSSGNSSVAGGAGQPGPTFVTHTLPEGASAPYLALPTAGIDNETSLHVMWLSPSGNGLPLLWHELMVDVAPHVGAKVGAADDLALEDGGGDRLAPSAGVDAQERSDTDDAAALKAAARADAEVACDGAASVSCSDVADGRCYVDVACFDVLTPGCGVGGHPLCRACAANDDAVGAGAGGACPPSSALRGAVALADSGLRVRLDVGWSAQGPMQVFLRGLPSGSVHTLAVRAHNALGPGAFSAVATLRTAGELSLLLLHDAGPALTVTIAAAGSGVLVSAVVMALCILGICRFCKTLSNVELTRRDKWDRRQESEKSAASLQEEKQLPEPVQDQLALWALMETPLSKSCVPSIDNSAGVEVSRVLTSLAKESERQGKCQPSTQECGKSSCTRPGVKSVSKAREVSKECRTLRANKFFTNFLETGVQQDNRTISGRDGPGGNTGASGGLPFNSPAQLVVGKFLERCFGAEAYATPMEQETAAMARMLMKEYHHFQDEALPEEHARNALHEVRASIAAPRPADNGKSPTHHPPTPSPSSSSPTRPPHSLASHPAPPSNLAPPSRPVAHPGARPVHGGGPCRAAGRPTAAITLQADLRGCAEPPRSSSARGRNEADPRRVPTRNVARACHQKRLRRPHGTAWHHGRHDSARRHREQDLRTP